MKVLRMSEVENSPFKVGDVISFNLTDGEEVEAMAVKQEKDGMVFVFVDCLKDEYPMNEHPMNEEDASRGGYEASDLRGELNNEILERFPYKIRKNLIAFENGDLLRLPTECEIFGENIYGENEPESVKQWEWMKDRRNRAAFHGKNGAWERYWLMNKIRGSADDFADVSYVGNARSSPASTSAGVRPAFKMDIADESAK